jgi:hypothetical protein
MKFLGHAKGQKALQKQGSLIDSSNVQYVQIIDRWFYSREATPNDQTDLGTKENYQAG